MSHPIHIQIAIDYLKYHRFKEHPDGNCLMYGLNTFGCESIIRFHDELWKFLHFKSGTDITVYVNERGELLEIDLRRTPGVTRMDIIT